MIYRPICLTCTEQSVFELENSPFLLSVIFQLMSTSNGAKWREDNVDSSTFNTNKNIDKLIQEVRQLH